MDSSQNNPFGRFSSGGAGPSGFSAPVSSGAGDDIILSGAAQKRSNKKLIIGIVVGVVLLIGAVVGFLMMQGNKSLGSDARSSFNNYVNYLLYGEASSDDLQGEYDESNYYKIDEMIGESTSKRTTFVAKANELLKAFITSSEKTQEDDFLSELDYYHNQFEFVRLLSKQSDISESTLEERIENDSVEVLKKVVTDHYSEMKNSNQESIKEYANYMSDYYNTYIDYLAKMKAAGCFSSVNDEGVCAEVENDDSTMNLLEDAYQKAKALEMRAYYVTVAGCYVLARYVYNNETIDDSVDMSYYQGSNSNEDGGGE